MSNPPIQIIGAGVNGLTTGLALQLLGYQTVCYTAHEPTLNAKESDPAFASRFPAASMLPHSVFTERLETLFADSQAIFRKLLDEPEAGLHINRHYELFEFDVPEPQYAGLLDQYETLTKIAPSDELPHRKGAQQLSGRTFECLFADWPVYYPQLLKWYKETGGSIEKRQLDTDDLREMPGEVVVNCSGQWAPELVKDPVSTSLIIGVTLRMDVPRSKLPEKQITSYNYTPGKEHYTHSNGDPVDVYCYPRKNGWILGGTRLKGWFDQKGQWMGETQKGPSQQIDGIEVPEPIIELNAQLIQQLYGFDIRDYPMRARFGYRFTRDSASNGLRLDTQEAAGKLFIHNYGHGGAGVSLSWGCALDVIRMIRAQSGLTEPNVEKPLSGSKKKLQKALQQKV